jgi:pimeloyl-ACP methyl ester carboxylesterase
LFGERRTKEMGSELEGWRLNGRVSVSLGEVAYGVYGEGPPVVLVHGTPSRSCIWREVVPTLAEGHAVYVYDLPGFGESERGEGQDVSIAAQGRVLAELIEAWRLDETRVAGHDIGGGIALRAHLLEGVPFERISLLDAVVLTPWGTPSLRHVKEHLGAYRTMPATSSRPMSRRASGKLRAADGRGGLRGVPLAVAGCSGTGGLPEKRRGAPREGHGGVGAALGRHRGAGAGRVGRGGWVVDPSQARLLAEKIPNAEMHLIPNAGHFVMEDAPGRSRRA